MLVSLCFVGCSGYSRFYNPLITDEEIGELIQDGGFDKVKEIRKVSTSIDNRDSDIGFLSSKCYFIGYSSFNGDYERPSRAEGQARKINADTILYLIEYTHTTNMTLALPSSNTSYFNGGYNTYGSGGYGYGNYSGSVTTYGTQNVNIPINRYDHFAAFFYCDHNGGGIWNKEPRECKNEKDKKFGCIEKKYEEIPSFGELLVEISYKNNKVVSRIETPFKNGKREGIVKMYYENESLLGAEIPYKDDQKEGIMKLYDENGDLRTAMTYKNNKLISGECGNGKVLTEAHLHNIRKDIGNAFTICK